MKRSSQIGGDLKTNLKNVILEKYVYFLDWRLSPTIMHMGLHCNEATRIKQLLATIFTYFNRQIRGALKLALKHILFLVPYRGFYKWCVCCPRSPHFCSINIKYIETTYIFQVVDLWFWFILQENTFIRLLCLFSPPHGVSVVPFLESQKPHLLVCSLVVWESRKLAPRCSLTLLCSLAQEYIML